MLLPYNLEGERGRWLNYEEEVQEKIKGTASIITCRLSRAHTPHVMETQEFLWWVALSHQGRDQHASVQGSGNSEFLLGMVRCPTWVWLKEKLWTGETSSNAFWPDLNFSAQPSRKSPNFPMKLRYMTLTYIKRHASKCQEANKHTCQKTLTTKKKKNCTCTDIAPRNIINGVCEEENIFYTLSWWH